MKKLKELLTTQEARSLIHNYGLDAESGMEYLNGLEVIKDGEEKMYELNDVMRFIHR